MSVPKFVDRGLLVAADAEIARLREAIAYADEVIHGEFCGWGHHPVCKTFREMVPPLPRPDDTKEDDR